MRCFLSQSFSSIVVGDLFMRLWVVLASDTGGVGCVGSTGKCERVAGGREESEQDGKSRTCIQCQLVILKTPFRPSNMLAALDIEEGTRIPLLNAE